MRTTLFAFKKGFVKAIAFFLSYFGMLKVVNRFVNRFELKKDRRQVLVFPFLKKREVRNVQILVYHRVNDDGDLFFPAIPVGVFEEQMDYLASDFNPISLEEAVERIKKRDIPENAVVITFDDGYQDNYENAFPILKKRSIPATIFLATGSIGSGKVLWHDRVFSAFRETGEAQLKQYGERNEDYSLATREEKYSSFKQVLRFLRSLNDFDRSVWIDRLVEKLKVVDRKERPDLMLSWGEVQRMRGEGISFGSHTVTHPVLSRLPAERIREEIIESKSVIERKLGEPTQTFAYPNGIRGDFNELSKRILKDAGYSCAVTMVFGTNGEDQDLFELRRGVVWDYDIHLFRMKLNYYKMCS